MLYFCLFIFLNFVLFTAPLRSNEADYVSLLFIFYRHPSIGTLA